MPQLYVMMDRDSSLGGTELHMVIFSTNLILKGNPSSFEEFVQTPIELGIIMSIEVRPQCAFVEAQEFLTRNIA